MKTILNQTQAFSITQVVIIFGLLILSFGCKNDLPEENKQSKTVAITTFEKVFWQIKAIHPDGKFLDVKAIDGFGNTFDVKAIQDANQKSLMDIKAFVDGKIVSVKILVNDGKFAPVKAIAKDGTQYHIKAIASNGDRLNIKGVKRSGNIVHIKAIDKNGSHYGVKAISPTGELNDVKGIKIVKEDLEYTLFGAPIYAHIKALPQSRCAGDNFLWHIVAIHSEGYTLEVMAIDATGNDFAVKAIRDSEQRSLLDIKAFIGNDQLPVKLVVSDDQHKSMYAIGKDGALYEIKAITPNGEKLDVKGIGLAGNIVHIKAIAKDGTFYGVKALSPAGQLNDVKGVKMFKIPVELKVNGVEVYAHVKALSPSN